MRVQTKETMILNKSGLAKPSHTDHNPKANTITRNEEDEDCGLEFTDKDRDFSLKGLF